MSKLLDLSDHLRERLDLLGINREQFESWQEDGTLEPGGRNETVQGVHLLDWRYRSVLVFERIPVNRAGLLLAFVQAWLDDYDPDRDDRPLPAPTGQIDLDDRDTLADVEINVEFIDPLYLVAEESGLIEWNGRRWAFGDYDLWTAEQFSVVHGADQSGPSQ